MRSAADGTLEDYPRQNRRQVDLVEDYRWLAKTDGLNIRQAAARLGVTHGALERAIYRQIKKEKVSA